MTTCTYNKKKISDFRSWEVRNQFFLTGIRGAEKKPNIFFSISTTYLSSHPLQETFSTDWLMRASFFTSWQKRGQKKEAFILTCVMTRCRQRAVFLQRQKASPHLKIDVGFVPDTSSILLTPSSVTYHHPSIIPPKTLESNLVTGSQQHFHHVLQHFILFRFMLRYVGLTLDPEKET